jgi:hypothetical protein
MPPSAPDYHSLVARAVSGLNDNTAETRHELYDRARRALVDQLRAVGAEDSEITREQRALAAAIGRIEGTTPGPRAGPRAPVWPVQIAPLVAAAYYTAMQLAFDKIVPGGFENAIVGPANLNDGPIWGMLCRLVGQLLAIGLGTFVAAGLARGRETAAGMIGGITISAVYIFLTAVFVFAWYTDHLGEFEPSPQPRYQYAIGSLIIVIAPLIGWYTSALARMLNERMPTGFAGIDRWHFLWLGAAVHGYALGLITPFAILFGPSYDDVSHRSKLIIALIPAALVFPAYFGLALLSGREGKELSATKRNFLGALVVISGGLFGLAAEYI